MVQKFGIKKKGRGKKGGMNRKVVGGGKRGE